MDLAMHTHELLPHIEDQSDISDTIGDFPDDLNIEKSGKKVALDQQAEKNLTPNLDNEKIQV
jgi:hypothetical protein